MMRFYLHAAVAAASILALAQPATATGKMTCDARKAKVDGGCYEVYGTDPEGRSVEAYFHPVSFKKLLVSRRGQVIFRAD
jgi:hypothetical protein